MTTHRRTLIAGDPTITALCTYPLHHYCPDSTCPRHRPDSYSVHAAHHLIGGAR